MDPWQAAFSPVTVVAKLLQTLVGWSPSYSEPYQRGHKKPYHADCTAAAKPGLSKGAMSTVDEALKLLNERDLKHVLRLPSWETAVFHAAHTGSEAHATMQCLQLQHVYVMIIIKKHAVVGSLSQGGQNIMCNWRCR